MSDIDYVEKEMNKLSLYIRSANYIPEYVEKIIDGREDKETSIEAHWIDRFNEQAKIRLEPWRQDLLARALAVESIVPGEVPLRVLWTIGMLDYQKFQALNAFFDLCSVIDGQYVIPSHNCGSPGLSDSGGGKFYAAWAGA
jgi:hypothetical protein